MKKEILPVIFRKQYSREDRQWEIVGFFPTLPAESSDWYNMECYAHVGQHSVASPQGMRKGKRASPDEYADLLQELIGIYENDADFPCTLKVYQKEHTMFRKRREANWRRSRG